MEKEKKRKDEVDKYVESKIPPIHYDLTMTTDSSMISGKLFLQNSSFYLYLYLL